MTFCLNIFPDVLIFGPPFKDFHGFDALFCLNKDKDLPGPHLPMRQDSTVLDVFGAFEGKTVGRALTGLGVLLLFFGTSLLVYFNSTPTEYRIQVGWGGLAWSLRDKKKPTSWYLFSTKTCCHLKALVCLAASFLVVL